MNSLLKMFRRLTIEELKAREKLDAEHLLLEAHTVKEHAESVISFNTARLSRLTQSA